MQKQSTFYKDAGKKVINGKYTWPQTIGLSFSYENCLATAQATLRAIKLPLDTDLLIQIPLMASQHEAADGEDGTSFQIDEAGQTLMIIMDNYDAFAFAMDLLRRVEGSNRNHGKDGHTPLPVTLCGSFNLNKEG
ncbi:MAG: hypothetical protein EOP04_04600 [Proteobacteria bacterium]|nr:MAG: hypothetical protein EOP04_04600 [Pseudomonadota bacterium]